MSPETFAAFHQALRFGPGYCPPELFQGDVPSIVRGLKVHANNISHARHVALEETYPRLGELIGLEAFHRLAELFLDHPHVSSRSLDAIGEGFEQLLEKPEHRNLARTEWAWLEAYRAAEAASLTLNELADMEPEDLLSSRLSLHPATRWITLENADSLSWDSAIANKNDVLLITRPDVEVLLRRIGPDTARILPSLSVSCMAVELLDLDPPSLIILIDAGAAILEKQP
jgi:hypothetical protein